jgi:hypothetical protein
MQQPEAPRELPLLLRPEGQSLLLRLVVCAAFVAVTGLSVWRVVRNLHDPAIDSIDAQALVDFHNAIYYPALGFREGINPYSKAYADQYPVNRQYPLYSPSSLLLYYPFALLPLSAANVVYFVISFGLVLALAASVLAICRIPLTMVNLLGLATLILLSRPGHINLVLGQITVPIVIAAAWALELARRRPYLSAIALALTTIKPTFGVPLVWFMFCRRDYRALFVGVTIAAVAAIAGAAPIIAHEGLEGFVESLRGSQSLHEDDPVIVATTSWTRLDALSVIGRFMDTQPGAAAELAIAAVCLLVAGAAVFRTSNSEAGIGGDSLSTLIISTATLACIYHSMYDALLLVLPWVGVMFGRLRRQIPTWALPILWLLLTIPAANYLSTRTAIERFGIEGTAWTLVTSVNGIAVLAALVLSIGLAFRPCHIEELTG